MPAETGIPQPNSRPQPEITLFGAAPPPEERTERRRPVIIFILAAVFIGAALALWFIGTHGRARQVHGAVPAYAGQIQLSDLKLSQAENFIGSNVTYLDGTVANNGNKTVTGATVEVTFLNSLNEVVQDEEQPLRILRRGGPYPQAIDVGLAPLSPHQSKEFRLTFEHISADWSQELPAVRLVDVTTK